MKFGTMVYEDEIYNLDYMTADEIKELLKKVESDKRKKIIDRKNVN